MNLNLITLATVKTQLGIATSDYDTDITNMIPIVSADIRKILNCQFDEYILITLTSGSADFISGLKIDMGQVMSGSGITDDTYIQSYDPTTQTYTMSANATAAGTYFYPTLNVSQWPTVSKMIFYKIGQKTTDAATKENLQAITYGNVSKTFSANEINKRFDYPQQFINDLGTPFAKTG